MQRIRDHLDDVFEGQFSEVQVVYDDVSLGKFFQDHHKRMGRIYLPISVSYDNEQELRLLIGHHQFQELQRR